MDASPTPTRPTPSRRTLTIIVAPLIGLIIASWIGDALAPSLVDTHPLVLIMLNARNRNLALTTNLLDPVSYYVVGTVRLLISDPLFYLLGYFYGDAAVRWMEKRSRTIGSYARSFEEFFGKAAYVLVAVAPNNFVCLFAGAAGMRPAVFIPLNVSGTIVRLAIIRALGDVFSDPINDILQFIQDYRLPLLAASIVIVGVLVMSDLRRGGEIEGLVHLEEELADAADDIREEEEASEMAEAALDVGAPNDDEPDAGDEAER